MACLGALLSVGIAASMSPDVCARPDNHERFYHGAGAMAKLLVLGSFGKTCLFALPFRGPHGEARRSFHRAKGALTHDRAARNKNDAAGAVSLILCVFLRMSGMGSRWPTLPSIVDRFCVAIAFPTLEQSHRRTEMGHKDE
jgi:hypothetical protein